MWLDADGWETQIVCNLHFPMGTLEIRIWNRRAFQDEKLSSSYCPGRGMNPWPPTHPGFITSKESHTLLVCPEGGGYWNLTSSMQTHLSRSTVELFSLFLIYDCISWILRNFLLDFYIYCHASIQICKCPCMCPNLL